MQFKGLNVYQRHSLGMIGLGLLVWLGYFAAVEILLRNSIHYIQAELFLIPFTWVIGYFLNTYFNIHQLPSIRQFITFCGLSMAGWWLFIVSTVVLIRYTEFPYLAILVFSAGLKGSFNVILQQAITFNFYSGIKVKGENEWTGVVDPLYDQHSFYHGNVIQRWWKRKIASHVMELAGMGNPIVDVGCGSSPILGMMRGKDKTGVDLDNLKINYMRELDKGSTYVIGDINKLDLPDSHFTTVICIEILEHLPNPNQAIKELARICKPGGRVIIAAPDFSTIRWSIIEVLYGLLIPNGYHDDHCTKTDEQMITNLCDLNGLKHVKTLRVFGCDMVIRFDKEMD